MDRLRGGGSSILQRAGWEKSGTFVMVPADQVHAVWTESEDAVEQVQLIGPFGITLVNGSDDPRNN